MPNIRIDDEVWRDLQKRATAFVDSPNDVLRRLLSLNDKTGILPSAVLLKPMSATYVQSETVPGHDYRKPILEYIVATGGRAAAHDILEAVEQKLKSRLTRRDYEPLRYGQIRWRINAMYERKHMAMEGLLKKGSPRGIWEITEQGKHWLSQH
jgi:hypothetical protein